MHERITVQQWMLLPRETRIVLAEAFNIPRTGITEIIDDRVVTDGHSNDNLMVITKEKMCEWIGSEETFHRAWEICISKANGIVNPPVNIMPEPIETKSEPIVEEKKETIIDKVKKTLSNDKKNEQNEGGN